jgi:predicted HicB family RNase H-like nuclease
MLNHKGYIGHVEFDDENEVFSGEVINTKDVITFQSDTAHGLKQAFIDSVEDYLEFCKEKNELAEKPFSGKFNSQNTLSLRLSSIFWHFLGLLWLYLLVFLIFIH